MGLCIPVKDENETAHRRERFERAVKLLGMTVEDR